MDFNDFNFFTKKQNDDKGLWSKFNDYLGSDQFANFGKGLEGVGAFASIGANLYGLFQSNKALKMQRQALHNAQKQQAIENARYEKRERERDEANAKIAKGAELLNVNRI